MSNSDTKYDVENADADFVSCLCFILNPVISLCVSIYYWFDTNEWGVAFGVFVGCAFLFVPICLLVIRFIYYIVIPDEKHRKFEQKAWSFVVDSDERGRVVKSCLKKISKNISFITLFLLISTFLIIGATVSKYDLSDGYYMLLRVITCATCVYSAVKFKAEWAKWIFGVLAVLYNPVLPVHLGDKDLWSIINLTTVVYMWIALRAESKAAKSTSA